MSMDNQSIDVLWIGAISWYKDGKYDPPVKYPGIVSASSFQQAIIEGMEKQGKKIRILSDSDMSSGERHMWSHNDNRIDDIRVGGVENKLFRLPVKTFNLCNEINLNTSLTNAKAVIAYEMHVPYLFALRKLKKENPEIISILICPDLTDFMDVDISKKKIKGFLKKIENVFTKKLLKYVDGYVFFTRQMREYFDEHWERPNTVIEGVFNDQKYDYTEVQKTNPPYIMHSGSLHTNMGIEELVEAFKAIDNQKVELHFFGSGEMDTYIITESKANARIVHHGFVDPQSLFEYEKRATLLANVRSPKEMYTRYSFPSKTFEFFASGTPLLCTDMAGIPDEYKSHMVLIPDNEIDTIKNAINSFFDKSDDDQRMIGLEARSFVQKYKNPMKQSDILIKFLDSLGKEAR